MTPEYRARRAAKHAAQAASKLPGGFVTTIDMTPKMASHAFVGLKSRPQGSGGRKTRSGYAQEHAQALLDNAVVSVVKSLENEGFETPKSIGGVSETAGIPTDDGTSV